MGRKFWLGESFLAACLLMALILGVDGLAAVIFAMSGGVVAIVWGNVQEHRAANGGG
jgi:hypothetical protein